MVSEAYDAYTDAASNSITFKATPYDPNVDNITWKYAYVAVGYPDWDYTTAYLIGDPDGDGIYSGYANLMVLLLMQSLMVQTLRKYWLKTSKLLLMVKVSLKLL